MSYLCTKIPKVPGFVRNVLKVYFFRRPVMKNISKINIRQSYPTKIAIRILLEFNCHLLLTRKYQRDLYCVKISQKCFFLTSSYEKTSIKRRGHMLLQLELIRIHQVFHCHLLLTHKNTKGAWLCEKYSKSGFFNIL